MALLSNVFNKGVRTVAYGFVGNTLLAIAYGLSHYEPVGTFIGVPYAAVYGGIATAIAAAAWRLIQYDPQKAKPIG